MYKLYLCLTDQALLHEDEWWSGRIDLRFHRECHVVSVTVPYGSILGFLDRSRYFFFQVAP
jgi:hypothetical protein